MSPSPYLVNHLIIPPVIIAMAAGAVLIIMEATTKQGLIVLLVLAPFYYIGAEILARKVWLDEQGVTIRKFLRSVRIEWSAIRALDAVRSGRRVFLIVLPVDGRPVLVTNTIQPFDDLLNKIFEQVADEKISDRARQVRAEPPPKGGPVIQAWIVCAMLMVLVVGKILGYS